MKKISKLRKKQIIVLAILLIVLVGAFFWLKPSFFKQEKSLSKKEGSEITSGPKTQETFYKADKVLTFAVIGDIHMGAEPSVEPLLKEALEKAKNYQAEFVILIGDLTKNGALEDFLALKEILDGSGLTYYLIPGNHDIGREAGGRGFDYFQELFGSTYQEVVYKLKESKASSKMTKKVRLFLLDTSSLGKGEMIINKEEWLWIKQKLDNNVEDPSELRLVFSQTPFDKFGWTESIYLREFFCESYVDGFFEADVHRTEFFYRACPIPGWEEKANVAQAFPTFKPGALFEPDNEFPGFLMMEYFDNHFFDIKKVFVGD
ncbi:metallophosphoesterase [Candidatus Microgenomates bacterium]|nr:metallophosphoesterase [Candidatus Microgenomates bacterium]